MTWSKFSPETKSAFAMIALCLFMGPFVYLILTRDGIDPLTWLGFRAPLADTGPAWLAGVALAVLYVAFCARIPAVRLWLVRMHPLKVLALILAVLAALLEEIAFRKLLMDWVERSGGGAVIQVAASGLAFGLAHAVWGGLKGNWIAAAGSVMATSVLGLGLAAIYLIGGRSLAPCIVSHFLVTALIEPGLLIAAFGNTMRTKAPAEA